MSAVPRRDIRALAEALADVLEERGVVKPPSVCDRVLSVADVADLLVRSRPWVYQHAAELGAFRFGTGPKARSLAGIPTRRGRDRDEYPPAGSHASREVRTPHSPASTACMAGLYTGAGADRKQGRTHSLHPDGARPSTVFTCAVGGEANLDGHAARMPIPLPRHLMAMTCPLGGLVLDPLVGNCTTGVAATRSGPRFIGIEINLAYAAGGRPRRAKDLGLLDNSAAAIAPTQLTVDDVLGATG